MKRISIAIALMMVALLMGCNLELVDTSIFEEIEEENQAGLESGFAGGNGTEASPFLIDNAEQFSNIEGNGYFKLTNDITLPTSVNFIDFFGKLDGDGHTITYVRADDDSHTSYLFNALRNGSVIRNINFDIGDNALKSLAYCTEGAVLLDNVDIYGTYETTGNNAGPYIAYLGYDSKYEQPNRQPSDLILRNCTNYVDIIDITGSTWGKAPFIHAYCMPGVEAQCTLTMENCVNNGLIFGGYVGWVFGNQSDVDKVGKVTIKNCSNGPDGSVVGVLDHGDYSWKGKEFRETDDVDDSFKNMTKGMEIPAIEGTASVAEATITVTTSLTGADHINFIVGYQVTGYTESNDTYVHMTYYIVYADKAVESDGIYEFDALKAIDSEYTGVPEDAVTDGIVTIDGTKYVYIGNELLEGESATVHSCLDRPAVAVDARVHSAVPESIYAIAYNANGEISGHGKITLK